MGQEDDPFDLSLPEPLTPGTKLFVESGHPDEIALVRYDASEARYIASFQEAAEVLSTQAAGKGFQDLLLFPMLFAYRHHLELQLKSLVRLNARWRGEDRQLDTHNLRALWREARQAIEEAFPGEQAELDEVEAIIHEFADIDPGSMSFRYARDRRGRINLPPELGRVNVAHFARVMRRVGGLLDGAETGIWEYLDAMPGEDYYD